MMKTALLGLLIVGLLAGGALYFPRSICGHTKEERIRRDILTLTSALRSYEMDAEFFPTTEQGLAALVDEPTVPPLPKRWKASLKKMITDAWGREYRYLQPGNHNPDTFDLWSLGPDGIESADDIGNWE